MIKKPKKSPLARKMVNATKKGQSPIAKRKMGVFENLIPLLAKNWKRK